MRCRLNNKLSMMTKNNNLDSCRGFSLIELILVIVILGVLAVGISSFIQFGTQVYTDAKDRDELVSSARFAIERLNRELRLAVPNSIRVNGNASRQCIEYTPIVVSAIYTDIPVAPKPASADVKVIAFNEAAFNSGFPNLKLGVYLLNANEFYASPNNKIYSLLNNTISKVGNEWTIKLNSAAVFAEDSPTQRVYFFNDAVSYCVQNNQLTRHSSYGRNADNTPSNTGVLMAENINEYDPSGGLIPPFTLTQATQFRNALILIKINFEQNNEQVVFNNEIQVPNVP